MKSTESNIKIPDQLKWVNEKMRTDLDDIESGGEDGLVKIKQCTQITMNAVNEIRKYIKEVSFENPQAEIYFFKHVKPYFYAKYIFFVKIYHIEVLRPTGGNEEEMNYLQKEMNRLTDYFEFNKPFYEYIRRGSVFMDAKYFVRSEMTIDDAGESHYLDADPNYCTSHDFKVARMLAHKSVAEYLKDRMDDLKRGQGSTTPELVSIQKLNWTASKVALIEIIYAFQSSGSFNHGEADIRQIADFFQRAFNISLGNLYRTFQEIRIRKKGRSFFLDQLKEELIRRMDHSDENPKL